MASLIIVQLVHIFPSRDLLKASYSVSQQTTLSPARSTALHHSLLLVSLRCYCEQLKQIVLNML